MPLACSPDAPSSNSAAILEATESVFGLGIADFGTDGAQGTGSAAEAQHGHHQPQSLITQGLLC